MTRTVSAAAVALCAGLACGQTATMPPQGTTFSGNTRGYYFTAPVDFRITGVHVLQSTGANPFMNWAIVRFDGNTPPPNFATTTNAFTQLGVGFNENSANFTPCSIEIHTGEVIGVYGNTMATSGATTGLNSYTTNGPIATTTIFGNNVNLLRSGMQFHLGSATSPQGMHDVWAEAASTSISRVEFNYEAVGVTGACCKPDGSCVATTAANCTTLSGTYQGDGVLCNAVTCPQPGACCLTNNTCSIQSSAQCAAANGTYRGNGTTCAVAGCPNLGACCLFDGSCLLVDAGACAAQSGVYNGNGTVCGAVNCPQPTCYSATGLSVAIADGGVPTNGTPGPDADASMVVTAPGSISGIMAGVQVTHTFQGDVAFKLVHPDGTSLVLENRPGVAPPKNNGTSTGFGFGNDNYGNPTTSVYMRFIDSASGPYDNNIGEPGPPAGAATAVDNPVGNWKASAGGSLNTTFNGKPVAGTWHLIANDYAGGDVGSVNAFQICVGSAVTAVCYPNCDHSTTAPCLNVQDFGCFLNSFASGDTYANCDSSTTPPVLNVQDFGCFLNSFASGCSNC